MLFITILVFHFNLFSPTKPNSPGFLLFAPDGKIIRTENTELVRTDVVKTEDSNIIFTDGSAPTPVFYSHNGYLTEEIDKNSFTTIPYVFRKYNKALIIGTGGGNDLVQALKAGISNIVGIELNPVTIRLMKTTFKDYSGGLYFHPAIKIINEEGRSYVQNTKDSYDLIVLHGTDTISTSSFISSANLSAYLYTKEAIKRYWETLSDRGILFICRTGPRVQQPINFLNMLQIYKTIEKTNLSKEIKKHLCIIETNVKNQNFTGYSILLSKSEFTKDEYDKLSSTSHQIRHFPGIKEEIEHLWVENSKFANVEAISDNKPTFYNFFPWQEVVGFLLFLVVPLLIFTFIVSLLRKDIGIRKGAFFLLLGMGYIAIEISIAERMLLFLRNPAYSMQVVLSSFLVFGGLGGYFGAALKKGRISLYSLILFFLVILYIGIFNLLYKYQLPNSWVGRIILSFLITGPIGFFTAIPFAIALSREKKKHIMYTIDAVGTTVGAFFIFFVHNYFGFNMGFIWAAFIYLMIPFFLKGG
jgi:spermidine synthase